MIKELKAELLNVKIYPSRSYLGIEAAELAAAKIKELLNQKEEISIIFSGSSSHYEFMKTLKLKANIDWNRINAFHMSEYIGLDKAAFQGFGNFLKAIIFNSLPFKTIHYLNGSTENPEGECNRYSALLQQYSADIVFMGIGKNCQIAFNNPAATDFSDHKLVKVVNLTEMYRQQQVKEGTFSNLNEVPLKAFTLTLPCLLSANYIFCIVPGLTKSQAVENTLNKAVNENYPSTILRTHPKATLFLDVESSNLLYKYAD